MKSYFAASLLNKEKYSIVAMFDESSDILCITEMKKLSNAFGGYDKNDFIKTLGFYKEEGFEIALETSNPKFKKLCTSFELAEKGVDGRVIQDACYKYFLTMYESGEIDIPKVEKARIDADINRIKPIINEKNGSITYSFDKLKGGLRALVVLMTMLVYQNKDLNYFLALNKAMLEEEEEPVSKMDRIRGSVNKFDDMIEQRLNDNIKNIYGTK